MTVLDAALFLGDFNLLCMIAEDDYILNWKV